MSSSEPFMESGIQQVPPSAARMYMVVLGVGMACALAIVTVYEITRPVIRRSRLEFRRTAL